MSTSVAATKDVVQAPVVPEPEIEFDVETYRVLIADPDPELKIEQGYSALRDPRTKEIYMFKGILVSGKGLNPDA